MLSAVQDAGQTQPRERLGPSQPQLQPPASSGCMEIRGAVGEWGRGWWLLGGWGAGENKHISEETEIRGLLGRWRWEL